MELKFLSFGDFGKSKLQLQQEKEAFEKLIFPYGEQHREKIKDLLYQIDNKKLHQLELIMSFVEGKQKYLQDQNIAAISRLIQKKQTRFSTEQIKDIIALILLDAQCDNIDQLPELTQIQDYAKSIEI